MPNLDDTLLQIKKSSDLHSCVYSYLDSSALSDNALNSRTLNSSTLVNRRLPFRYSKLVCGLSACLLVQAAYAVEPSKPEDIDQEYYNPNLGKAQIQTNEETEEALIALKLKNAVEQGLIDPSVLEDYQRETLQSPVKKSKSQAAKSSTKASKSNPQQGMGQGVNASDLTGNSKDLNTGTSNEDSEAIFDRIFSDNNLEVPSAGTNLAKAPVMQSPQQLDQVLSEIGTQVSSDFDQPIARLEATEPPLGFDTALDKSAQINPTNKKTLGIPDTDIDKEQLEATKPVYKAKDVSVNPDTEEAKAAEEKAQQSVKNAANNKVEQPIHNAAAEDDITEEDVVESQQNGTLNEGINPEEYLPEYEEESGQNLPPVNVENPDQQDEEAENKPGFIKGLYNKLFKDGVNSLPKIKADLYLQQNSEDASQPLKMVKADTDNQPFTNIKAALENITVESISDFTAVTPKLNQTAIDAAQAVGYYDIDMSFRKTATDEVEVIIEYLGDPVRVNSRNIDIRGEGAQLKEFKEIQQEAPPKTEDIFNHGVYKQAKQQIETTKEQFGFFDGQWLNKSVDVILPDNTADVDLVYDTGERYHFDEVVFFTVDEETGQLTTDPDKLPVKAELLHQLHQFKVGDKFYAPDVTEFTNDLSATRYFNAINVEAVRPNVSRATLGFDDSGEESRSDVDSDEQLIGNNQSEGGDSELPQIDENGELISDSDSPSQQTANDLSDEFEPIEYSVDQETTEKLNEITAKAERLSRLPDDRVLDETEEEAKNLLGKISNAISDVAKKIVPDEKEKFSETSGLPDDLSRTVLANRKTPKEVQQTKSVPLYVFVAADKTRDVDLGIGYGTDTGVRAVARIDDNLVNRDGYQAGMSVGASKVNKSVNLYASRPWKHPLNDTLNASISYEQETIDQGEGNLDLDTNTIKASLSRNIRKENGWNQTYSVRYRQDGLESGVKGPDREKLPVPFNRKGARFDQEALLFGYRIDKAVTDNAINPSRGWHQYYSLEAGTESVLSDTDMAIARAGVTGVYSFGEMNKHQVIGSLDGGYIWADDFENVPYKLRFFAGGDGSIRGYDYKSLSALENDYLVGGQVLAVGSGEYNYEFKPGLRGAVFADVGNAYDTDFETETKLGVGFGVRWASPVGTVRVDLAAGVLEDSIPIRLHFFIGSPLQ